MKSGYIYLFLYIIFTSCGKSDLAGGTVEIPSGVAEGIIKSPDGKPLSKVSMNLIPTESQQLDQNWISEQTDTNGYYKIKAEVGRSYNIIIRDSINHTGAFLQTYWDSTNHISNTILLRPLKTLSVKLNPNRSIHGWIGLQGTDIWQRLDKPVDSVVLDQIPYGRYRLLLIDDSTNTPRIIQDSIQIDSQDLKIIDSTLILFYASDSLTYQTMSIPLIKLGIYTKLALPDTFNSYSKVSLIAISPKSNLNLMDINQIKQSNLPFLCANPKYYYDLELAIDNDYLNRLDKGSIAKITSNPDILKNEPIGKYFSIYDNGVNAHYWTPVPNEDNILLSSLNGYPIIFQYLTGDKSVVTGQVFHSPRIGYGIPTMNLSNEFMRIYQKLFIKLINRNQFPDPL